MEFDIFIQDYILSGGLCQPSQIVHNKKNSVVSEEVLSFFVEKEKFGFDIKASPFKRKPHINGKKKSK